MAWYNKYRPQKFEDVVGQTLVKTVLQNAISKQVIKHAYLFSGPKGTGKTTLARIFARELINKSDSGTSVDIIEMDAASNTGVDDIRQLIESANIPPLESAYKIYIIDEVHMLSKSAMNALLKTLEEPPSYLVFLLATTNPEKLLPTVLSRLTKLNLSSHTTIDIVSQLKKISAQEGVKIDDQALQIIAKHSNGGQRDAINHLETLASYGLDNYDSGSVSQLLGLLPLELLENVATALLHKNLDSDLLNKLAEYGYDGETFLGQLMDYLLDASLNGNPEKDALIIPLAEVISLKLPIYSAVSSLAIVQAKLSSLDFLDLPKNINKTPTIAQQKMDSPPKRNFKVIPEITIQPTFPRLILPIEDQSQGQNLTNVENKLPDLSQKSEPKIDSEAEVKTAPKIQSPKIEPTPVIIKAVEAPDQAKSEEIPQTAEIDFKNFCAVLANDAFCPLTLKVMLNNLHVESQSQDNLTLSVGNSIFFNQLNSPRTQEFLRAKLLEISDYNGQLIIKKRDPGIIDTAILDTPINMPERIFEPAQKVESGTGNRGGNKIDNSYNPAQTANSLLANSALDLSHIENTIFYEVYGEIPEQMAEKGVPAFRGEIPKPAPSKTKAANSEMPETSSDDDWDSHIADFELE